MKQIVALYQDGQQLLIVQCSRCKEVFNIAVEKTALAPEREETVRRMHQSAMRAAMALGEQHKAECEGINLLDFRSEAQVQADEMS